MLAALLCKLSIDIREQLLNSAGLGITSQLV
jgi:hypothetical protein